MKKANLFSELKRVSILFWLVAIVTTSIPALIPNAYSRVAPATSVSGDPTVDEGPKSGPKTTARVIAAAGSSTTTAASRSSVRYLIWRFILAFSAAFKGPWL
jgi:hypothetical protein